MASASPDPKIPTGVLPADTGKHSCTSLPLPNRRVQQDLAKSNPERQPETGTAQPEANSVQPEVDAAQPEVDSEQPDGGAGNDTYIVDNAADVVTESLNQGIDTVRASVSYTLTNNVENLVLTGNALNGFGNDLNNTITISSNNNNLIHNGNKEIWSDLLGTILPRTKTDMFKVLGKPY